MNKPTLSQKSVLLDGLRDNEEMSKYSDILWNKVDKIDLTSYKMCLFALNRGMYYRLKDLLNIKNYEN